MKYIFYNHLWSTISKFLHSDIKDNVKYNKHNLVWNLLDII